MKFLYLFLMLIGLISCTNDSKKEKEIAGIAIDFTIERFDRVFADATINDLPKLKQEYPVFFPERYNDSIWEAKMQDTLQSQLEDEILSAYPNNEKLNTDLLALFQHIKYYFPQFKAPNVFTTTSDVDYRNKVILKDDLLVLALDNYLGANHPFYDGIPKFTSKNLKESQIIQDVANEYARQLTSAPRQRSLLAIMVYYGKLLYMKDLLLPNTSDSDKIGYTNEELSWAMDNEDYIWRYFIENELLFSTDAKLPPRFINPAPFSKFYLEIDNDSPGMIGRYIGWQIVKAYMENNPISLQQLMIADTEELYKKSKYKPKK